MKTRTRIAIPFLIVMSFVILACGPDRANTGLEYVGSTLWTKAYDIAISDNYAYCAFLNGLVVLDIEDRKKPDFVSQVYLGGGFGIAVKNNLAILASGKQGLQIVDVSDPKNPVHKSLGETPGEAKDVVIDENRAYVADGTSGLQIFDITDPSSPRLIGSLDTEGFAGGVAAKEKLVCVADGESGLQIINVDDPTAPKLTTTLDTPGNSEKVVISENYAIVADGYPGLQIVDVSDPSSPELATTFLTSSYANNVCVNGRTACVGNLYDGGSQLVDISDPGDPVLLSTTKHTAYNEACSVAMDKDYVYVVDYFSGIHILSKADPKNPELIGLYYTPASIITSITHENIIYAVGNMSGLKIINASDLNLLPVVGSYVQYPEYDEGTYNRFIGQLLGLRNIQGLAFHEGYIYQTGRRGMSVYNVGDPQKIKLVRTVRLEGVTRKVVIENGHCYVTSDLAGLHILDL
ncbi:MAG: hypothetical protein PVI66_16705, partial [Candidatus Aminicenantes bacterium]